MVYLQITLKIAPANRAAAAGVYQRHKWSAGVVRELGPLLDAAPDVRIYQVA